MDSLTDIARKPARAWQLDGIVDLSLGLYFGAQGALFLLWWQGLPHPPRASYFALFPVAQASLSLIFLYVWRRAVPRWKERIAVPRIGYLEMRAAPVGRRMAAGLSVVAVSVLTPIALVTFGAANVKQAVALVCALALTLSLIHTAVYWSMPRYFVVAGVASIVGMWAYRSSAGFKALAWLLLWVGVSLAAVGVMSLIRFLQMPLVPQEHRS